MTRIRKVFLIIGAYLAAFFIALAGVQLYIAATNTPDRNSAQGMYAFGDSILFLAILAVASIPATCIALYYLRRHPFFWKAAVTFTFMIIVTGLLALLHSLPHPLNDPHSYHGSWADLSPIRVLLAPMFGLVFLLAMLFSPARFYRLAFLSAFFLEILVFVSVVLIWTHSARY
jgi:hypothetical protein